MAMMLNKQRNWKQVLVYCHLLHFAACQWLDWPLQHCTCENRLACRWTHLSQSLYLFISLPSFQLWFHRLLFLIAGDGRLSHEEFVAIMRHRVQRGFGVSGVPQHAHHQRSVCGCMWSAHFLNFFFVVLLWKEAVLVSFAPRLQEFQRSISFCLVLHNRPFANYMYTSELTVKSQIFVRYLFSYISYFWKSTKFNIVWKFLFGLKPLNFNVIFFADPRKYEN